MNQQTEKKNNSRHNDHPRPQVNKLAEIAGANSTDDVLRLVLEMVEDLGAAPEKITLVRGSNAETITSENRRASAKSVEIGTDAADGKTRLAVTCSGQIDARLRRDVEAVLQVGAISAELCARKLWQPAATTLTYLRQNAGLLGESPSMKSLTAEIEKLGRSARPAMITGERGTGKTTIARAIHENSSRTGAFVDLDCTALTESLLESELFGYEKGAFTGALTQKRGMFEAAEGGTLFLDEIGDLPLAMQAKLLKAIEQQKIRRLGATKDTKIDVRVIAATSRDLVKMKNEGLFREDLFDRLSVLEIRTCPLREKREDIPVIISHQLKEEERLAGKDSPYEIEEAAVGLLQSLDWPGNIRQLRNFITRLVVKTEGVAPISVEDVCAALESASDRPMPLALAEAPVETALRLEQFPQKNGGQVILPDDVRSFGPGENINRYLARVTKSLIETTLKQCDGNISQAALRLGLHRNTMKFRLATANQILAEAA